MDNQTNTIGRVAILMRDSTILGVFNTFSLAEKAAYKYLEDAGKEIIADKNNRYRTRPISVVIKDANVCGATN